MPAWCHRLIQVSLDRYRGRMSTYRDKVWTCRDCLWIFRSSNYDCIERVSAYFQKFSWLLTLLIAVGAFLLFFQAYLNFEKVETQQMLVTDHRLERVQTVVQTILQSNQELQDIKTRLITHVLNDSRAIAFAKHSVWTIAVFDGMLKLVASDDELSFVLGHEIAHVVLKRGPRQLKPSWIISLVNIMSLLVIWQLFRSLSLAIMTILIISGLVVMLSNLQTSRHNELDADYFGFAIAAKAGYDTRQAGSWMRKYAERTRTRWTELFPTWLFDHPDGQERAAYLDYYDQDVENRQSFIAHNRSCQNLNSKQNCRNSSRLVT